MPKAVEEKLQGALQGNEGRLKSRLQRARADGQLPADAQPDLLASFYMAIVAGLGVLAKAGARRAKLEAVVDQAMRAWPALTPRRARQTRPSR